MSINKLNDLVLRILRMLGIIDKEEDNVSMCINLCVVYFTNFKYKVSVSDNKEESAGNLLSLCNKILSLTNSHFVLIPQMTREEFINFTLYFMTQFNFVQSFLDYLSKINKKYIAANIKGILLCNPKNSEEVNYKEDIRVNFNKMSNTIKSIKKQTDLLINLMYKLNSIKNCQEKPVRYVIRLF